MIYELIDWVEGLRLEGREYIRTAEEQMFSRQVLCEAYS